jgi:ABC-2 type transport system ATP-binding protein
LVRRLVDEDDTTILLTTHDLDEAERLADRILILAGGRIVADGSAGQLASSVSREAEVRWRRNGESHAERTTDPTGFVRSLFARFGAEVTDLDLRRATLEDTYLAMVHRHESGIGGEAETAFEEVDR